MTPDFIDPCARPPGRAAFRHLLVLVLASMFGACGDSAPPRTGGNAPATPVVAPAVGGTTAAAPGTVAARYEGRIVRQPPAARGKDDGWYLVRNGRRHWIVESGWLARNGYTPDMVTEITSADFAAIPEDPAPLQ